MKINEVEQLVGVTKRNIRFYEKEGLLNPGRTQIMDTGITPTPTRRFCGRSSCCESWMCLWRRSAKCSRAS